MNRFAHIEDVHRRIFAAMLANMDDSVGAVLAAVRAEGLEEDTLLFFLSDNGGPTRELTSSNLPLRGEKGQMFEGGLRVPFMVQWKGSIPSGQVYDLPVSSMDILPTAAALAGAEPRDVVEGVDLMPYLTGKKEGRPHEWLFWRQGKGGALMHGDWKLVSHALDANSPDWSLFDLANDIGEANNVAGANPERLQALVEFWREKNSEMREPLFR